MVAEPRESYEIRWFVYRKEKLWTEETTEEKKPELEEYSEGVQKRIAKLTKKWREAERQREAALEFAKGGQTELETLKQKLAKLEPGYVNAMEGKLKTGLEAAKAQLLRAREAGDINAEVDAQRSIAQLTVEETRLNALKERQSQDKEKNKKSREKKINKRNNKKKIC